MRLRNAVLVALAMLVVAGCNGKEEPEKPVPAAELVSPEPYRREITTIDHLVFSGNLDERYRMMLVGNLAALAGRLDLPGQPPSLAPRIKVLRSLSAYVRDVRTPEAEPELQRQWASVRRSIFGDEPWFARSSADVTKWPGDGVPVRGGETPAVPAHVAAPPRFELAGRWAVAEAIVNGETPDPSEGGALWSFDEEGVTIDRGRLTGTWAYIEYIDSRGTALRLEGTDGGAGGWLLYQFSPNGKLVVAFRGDLAQRPEGFVPEHVELEVGTPADAPPADASTTAATETSAQPGQDPSARPPAPARRVGPRVGSHVAFDPDSAHYLLTLDPVQ